MREFFYPKLAINGIKKNKRLYFPYILTGSVMIMMYYILAYLAKSPILIQMKGGSILSTILPLGSAVIAIFSAIFLFYTNSFLIRQRNREFGLYNILGMDKRNISCIMFWENMVVAAIVILCGLTLGIALSKLAEVCLLNILGLEVNYELKIGVEALKDTAGMFGVIYVLLLANSLIKVCISKPLELLHSNKVGERPPRANWILAVVGVALLGVAYYIAVSVDEPLTAFLWFFGAVIMVILATYLLFITGSVAFCCILQKNKGYYYKPNHFVSVSSMVYRMKRNGAGLASICILSTMVLVMISSTASLYIGAEDSMHTRYPYDIQMRIDIYDLKDFQEEIFRDFRSIAEESCENPTNVIEYRTAEIAGLFVADDLVADVRELENFNINTYDDVGIVQIIPLEDYNRMMGTSETLETGECFIYGTRMDYEEETISFGGETTLKVERILDDFFVDGNISMQMVPTISVVTNDFDFVVEPMLKLTDSSGNQMMQLHWNYGLDMEAEDKTKIAVADAIDFKLREFSLTAAENHGLQNWGRSVECRAKHSTEFYTVYGSLFFLGIMLSIVFVFAAVLIIYYKQISEGYEDQARFEIMQKVGMTKGDIRRSINSQILTVFFLPLIFAGLHLSFAFPMVWKLLQLFNLQNLPLLIIVTLVCFLIFGLFYGLVYKLTAGVYYTIVSGAKEKLAASGGHTFL